MSSVLKIALILAIVSCSYAFSPSRRFNHVVSSKTQVFENFDAFEREEIKKKATKVGSNPAIFTEMQLFDYTEAYSEQGRGNILDECGLGFINAFFSKGEEVKTSGSPSPAGFAKSLRPSVSVSVLEEKTVLFVKGKSDAKTYYAVLKAAFGDKLKDVLPQILANLPANKAAELQKIQS